MKNVFFVVLVASFLWFAILIATWFPPWPKRDDVLNARQRIADLRGKSLFRYAIALTLNSYLAYPVHGAVIAAVISAVCITVIK